MDYIGAPGAATHNAEYVLDLTFSNVPFATTQIREDLHSGSDHETQVTTLLGRGRVPLDQFHYRVPEEELSKLAGIVKSGVAILPDPATLGTQEQIDEYIRLITECFQSALKIVGRPDRGSGIPAPWWTTECNDAYQLHKSARAA
jgi:hypothetical protein